jgi:hypothetical protein
MAQVARRNTKSGNKKVANGKRIQYVLPVGNGWVVKSSYRAKWSLITVSKREAITIARNLAKETHTELIVFAKDGRITIQANYA